VFFVVDRRVVVDAAFDRMKKIETKLGSADEGVLKLVAERLRLMAGGKETEPVYAYQLRGGIYRDDSWVRTPLQPALIASTVDQVGSRLLFRGYGVWDKVLPIHAGLIVNDALILLDEAHCSRAFAETLVAVQRYRGPGWWATDVQTPFAFVEMTATPTPRQGDRFGLAEEDFRHPEMRKRLFAPKPAHLIECKARSKDLGRLAETLAEEAVRLAKEPGLRRIGVMVNRVRTARLVYAALEGHGRRVHLLIGRMRPVDRLDLPEDLKAMFSGEARKTDQEPVFVVATQCLEVGADLDFDCLVTECAAVDALMQRFGRVDRIGMLHASGVSPQGRVLIASAMADPKYVDPVYGTALAKTWGWLRNWGDQADFGICSVPGDATVRERLAAVAEPDSLRRESPPIPALLPAHLDVLVQTSPRPALEPDIQLYLHGVEGGSPEVQVVWRADLPTESPEQWAEIVSLCPPVSAEAMPVPLREFRAWLTRGDVEGVVASDVEGIDTDANGEEEGRVRCNVMRWRGADSSLIRDARSICPGDTLVLAESSGGWNDVGHIPARPGALVDAAERARLALRRWLLRLHPVLLEHWPENAARGRLVELARQPAVETDEVVRALDEYGNVLEGAPEWLVRALNTLPKSPDLEAYPSKDGVPAGWVLSERFAEADAGADESSASAPVVLSTHLTDVTAAVDAMAAALIPDQPTRTSLIRAAQLHDCGKADVRFQALLHGGDTMAAQFAPRLLAKGSAARQSPQVRRAQWARSELPDGFRHELISLLLAGKSPEIANDDLALHLIASHHGRCRPFAPVVKDTGGDLAYNGWRITSEQRSTEAAHRLDSGVADRFWKLSRLYGWWGLAYLEGLLRLSDWKASQEEAQQENRV
jgi:CRISPR-associated endonuclease/helicase Cas3